MKLRRTRRIDPKIERIRQCAPFARLPEHELAEIAEIADELHVPAGHRLTQQGRPARQAMVLIEGACAVVVDGIDVAALGPGDLVGEMGLLGVCDHSATVTATTPSDLLVFNPRSFASFVELREAREHVMRQFAHRLRRADRFYSGP